MRHEFSSWRKVQISTWLWPNFTPEEWACKGTGRIVYHTEMMDALQGLRDIYGAPLVISSGYRSPEYDKKIGGKGPHQTGLAVDILCSGADAHKLLRAAMAMNKWTGIGVSQKGNHASRFIHFDMISDSRTRPWLWGY